MATRDRRRDQGSPQDRRTVRVALVVVAVVIALLAVPAAVFGHRAYRDHGHDERRALLVQVAEQAAINLTTIDFNHVDADIARILDSSTGPFRSDFSSRSPAFAEFIRKVQSKTDGTVTESGIESQEGDRARVLVALSVNTSSRGVADPKPRKWRMRLTVETVGADGAKVSAVEFVP